MAEPIPNREYQAFIRWFKGQGFKGKWAPNIGGATAFAPGFGDIREDPYYKAWVANGRPEPTPKDITPSWAEGIDPEVLKKYYPEKVPETQSQVDIARQKQWGPSLKETGAIPIDQLSSADITRLKELGWTEKSETSPFGVTTKTLAPPVTTLPEEEAGLEWYVPGQVLWDRAKKKFYDASGQAEISAADATQMRTDYDRGVSTQWQPKGDSQMDFLLLQSREVEKQRAWNASQQWVSSLSQGSPLEAKDELQRLINYKQFEIDRANLIAGTAPNDWIQSYINNLPNPYIKEKESPIVELENRLDATTAQKQKLDANLVIAQNQYWKAKDSGDTFATRMTKENVDNINSQLDTITNERDDIYKVWKEVQDESVGWTPQPKPNLLPDTPAGLSQYVPGLETGQMITKQNVPTPSGQQLTAMSPTQTEQLGYYTKWAGQNWGDILNQAKLNQPYTPPGAGRFRTTPARQWV